jgi:PAS domain S-box-containing protein
MSVGAKIVAGFAAGLVIILAIGASAYLSTQRLLEANRWVTHTHEVIEGLQHALSMLKDAETGQRGFVLTGEERYLEPYNAAAGQVQHDIDALVGLTRDNPAQQESLQQVQKLADAKLAVLRETIQLRRKSGLAAALPVILTDRGEKIMEELRGVLAEMKGRELQLLEARNAAANASANRTISTVALWMPLALLVLAVAAVVLLRTARLGGPAVPPGPPGKKWGLIALRYLSAVAVVAVAVVLRWRLLDSFGPMPAFLTFYPAVLLVATIGGGGPGIVATVLAALAADYWFLPPVGTFRIEAPNDVLALGIFTATSLFLCILMERLRRARWAEATSAAQEQQLQELSRLNEELSQQSEELSQQSEELGQQNEELQAQSEEIQALNAELTSREEILQKLLDAARLGTAEQAVLQEICAGAKELFGPAASAVLVLEPQGGRLAVRAQAGLGPEGAQVQSLPAATCLAELVIAEDKTAALTDAALRPDLTMIDLPGEQPFRAVLAAPMRSRGRPFGVVGIYSHQKQEWTAVQFHLAEWLSAQCAHILETLRLQEELRRLYAEQQTIFDSVPAMIWYKDTKNNFVRVNRAVALSVGKPLVEIEGKSAYEVFPDEAEHYYQDDREVIHSGQPKLGIQEQMATARGEKRWVQTDKIPYRGEGGDITGVLVFSVDITERKRAEEALRSVAQFPNENPYPVLRIDRAGTVLYANRSSAALLDQWQCEVGRPASEPMMRLVRETLDNGRPAQIDIESGGRVFSFVFAPVASGGYVNLYGRDITDRKRAEESLTRLAAIVASSDDAILSKDLGGIIQTWNTGANRLFGYRAEEVIGQPVTLLLPPERIEEEAQILDRVLSGEHIEHLETVRVTKDGRRLDVSVTVSPVMGPDGRIVGASKIVRDITDRKRVEQERDIGAGFLRLVNESQGKEDLVRAAVTFFQEKSDCEAVGIRLKDGDDYPYYEVRGFSHDFVFLENQLCARDDAGQPIRDSAGNPVIECMCGNVICGRFDPSKPFFTARGNFWTNCTTELLASTTEADRQAPTRNRCNGQGYESVALIALAVGQDRLGLLQLNDRRKGRFTPEGIALWERLAGYLAVALAKTQAEESLARERANLRAVFDVVNVGMLVIGEDGAVRQVNDTLSRWVRRDVFTWEGGQPGDFVGCVHALADPAGCGRGPHCDSCPIRNAFASVLRTGQPVHDVEAEALLSVDGRELPLWIEVNADPLVLDGKPHVILAMNNITNRKQADEALRRTAEDLARSNKDLEQFAYVASHDLKEPLRMVTGFMGLLKDRCQGKLDAKSDEYIAFASDAASRMRGLIDDLLAYSRAGRGEMTERTEVGAVVDGVLKTLSISIQESGAAVTCDSLPAITSNAVELTQVFQNLIGNAVKFKGERKPEIHVGARRQPGRWLFTVRDNGIGIDPQFAERIFMIFQRLHTREQYPGTGIGLAVCKKIVERHGGRIWVESEPGKGSTFCFTIPDPRNQPG